MAKRKRSPREALLIAVQESGYEAAEAEAMGRRDLASTAYGRMKRLFEKGERDFGRDFRMEMQKKAKLGTRRGRHEQYQSDSAARRRRVAERRRRGAVTRHIPLKTMESRQR